MTLSRRLAKLAGWCRWHDVTDVVAVYAYSYSDETAVQLNDLDTFERLAQHPNVQYHRRFVTLSTFELDGVTVHFSHRDPS